MINSYTGEVFVDVAKVEDTAFKRANDKDPRRRQDTMIHHHRYSEECSLKRGSAELDDKHKYIPIKEKTDD